MFQDTMDGLGQDALHNVRALELLGQSVPILLWERPTARNELVDCRTLDCERTLCSVTILVCGAGYRALVFWNNPNART
jgi:hypothetical protein